MDLVTVKKMNRVLTVDANNVDSYLRDGYDQIDEKGQIVKPATGGKMISLPEHNAALVKIAELREEIKVLEEENIRLDKLVKQLKGNNK